jgi:hypothetical protein
MSSLTASPFGAAAEARDTEARDTEAARDTAARALFASAMREAGPYGSFAQLELLFPSACRALQVVAQENPAESAADEDGPLWQLVELVAVYTNIVIPGPKMADGVGQKVLLKAASAWLRVPRAFQLCSEAYIERISDTVYDELWQICEALVAHPADPDSGIFAARDVAQRALKLESSASNYGWCARFKQLVAESRLLPPSLRVQV